MHCVVCPVAESRARSCGPVPVPAVPAGPRRCDARPASLLRAGRTGPAHARRQDPRATGGQGQAGRGAERADLPARSLRRGPSRTRLPGARSPLQAERARRGHGGCRKRAQFANGGGEIPCWCGAAEWVSFLPVPDRSRPGPPGRCLRRLPFPGSRSGQRPWASEIAPSSSFPRFARAAPVLFRCEVQT